MTFSASNFLQKATIDSQVHEQHPTYSALLVVVEGIGGGASDERSEEKLSEAESLTEQLLANSALEDLEEVQLWRAAYASFGVKPRVARSSVEALIRRSSTGLPRVDLLTDLYNAISIKHRVPIGGEDLTAYVGAARLVVATGDEQFDTMADGLPIDSPPDIGEIVWRDDIGVTCRRWNWRQCVRTRLTHNTTHALFIFDGLGTGSDVQIQNAADELIEYFQLWWPEVKVHSRMLRRL